MFWLHLGQLFLLAWVIIGLAALISMQKKAERETRAMMDVLVSIIKNLPNTAVEFDPKSPYEFKTEDEALSTRPPDIQ